jgi:pyruvate dehydrogenase E1 component subunit alpha
MEVTGATMPRTPLEPRFTVEYLSILDAEGNLDTALEPDIAADELKRIHRAMVLGRRLDERMVRLQRQGRIGTFAPIKGQEAAQIGSVVTLAPTDWMVPSFRETAAMLWRGWPLEKLLLFFAGYLEGGQPGPAQHDLPITIPVATQLPHAVGLAYAAQYRGDEAVVMVYFGDGATSEGDFHEAMNFAGVWHLPIVFVCQNNQWAISVPVKKQTHSRTIAQKALAYGLPGLQVDGNDVLAVYAASREAVERARDGDGPTLIECVTYRLGVHTTADDPTKYRSEEEVKEWERKDPLTRFAAYMEKKNLLEAGLDEQVDADIARAVAAFEAVGPADPLTMFDHVYAELPAHLAAQREALARRLGEAAARPAAASGAAGAPPASPPMRGQRTSSRWPS